MCMMTSLITIVTVHFILLHITMLHSLDCLPTLTFQTCQIQQRYVLADSYLNLAVHCRFGQRTGSHPSSSQVRDHCFEDKILQDLPSPSNPVIKHLLRFFPCYFISHLPHSILYQFPMLFSQWNSFHLVHSVYKALS